MSLPPFQRFLDEQRDVVWRFAAASVGPDDADDVFQETFLAALRAYPRLRPRSNLRGWVLTIAHRKALDHHRARRRELDRRRRLPPPATADSDGWDDSIWRAVRELPPKQRSALLLRYVEDLPYRDIGRALDCSEAAARRSAHEGLGRLRKVLP